MVTPKLAELTPDPSLRCGGRGFLSAPCRDWGRFPGSFKVINRGLVVDGVSCGNYHVYQNEVDLFYYYYFLSLVSRIFPPRALKADWQVVCVVFLPSSY